MGNTSAEVYQYRSYEQGHEATTPSGLTSLEIGEFGPRFLGALIAVKNQEYIEHCVIFGIVRIDNQQVKGTLFV